MRVELVVDEVEIVEDLEDVVKVEAVVSHDFVFFQRLRISIF